jgi:predicted DNA-binding transcriptional regulator YafY
MGAMRGIGRAPLGVESGAMNRIERLTAILLLLRERPLTSGEIARRFEVSKRTVLRDVQALCEMGIPVIAREGAGGGYALPADYRPAPLPLTAGEAFLLLLSLGAVTGLADAPFARERATLLAKLRALVPRRHLPDVEQLLAAAAVDVPRRAQRSPFLEPLLVAARDGHWLRVTYQSAERLSAHRLLPRRITAQNGFWYCHAYVSEHREKRTFRVDRVRAVAPASDPAPGAPPVEPLPYGHESHPEVVVELTARGVAYVESEPHLGELIRRRPDGTGCLAFRCPPGELDWFARYFAQLGADADVRAPEPLRERLAELGRELAERYAQR